MTDFETRNPNEDDLVDCCFGCPRCHERRVDELVWLNDEEVECQTCGKVYSPLEQ